MQRVHKSSLNRPTGGVRNRQAMGGISGERARWLESHILPHEPALRAWLAKRPPSLEEDDVVQEAYAVLAGLALVAHIQNPRAYFFRVAHSIVLQQLRRRPVVSIDAITEFAGLDIPDPSPSPERQAGDRQELRRIATLIDGLPARCREAFILRKLHEISQRDVATRMGISENTVEKQICKALRVLTEAGKDNGKAWHAAARQVIELTGPDSASAKNFSPPPPADGGKARPLHP